MKVLSFLEKCQWAGKLTLGNIPEAFLQTADQGCPQSFSQWSAGGEEWLLLVLLCAGRARGSGLWLVDAAAPGRKQHKSFRFADEATEETG